MKRHIVLLAALCLYSSISLFAQTVRGTVLDTQSEPVAYANIALYNATDSSLVKVELSDDDGKFKIDQLQQANYWLEVSYVGMPSYTSEVFDLQEDYEMGALKLEASNVELEEVTVVAKRPLLEVKPDKMVFNVEGSINASGNDALQLLRKAPGVIVDNNDRITMLGKSGVRIYIDGKPSPLTGEELASYLKTIQASEIDNIEIITNPSAKYDAEGSGGIINIKMKKDKRHGTNASVNMSYSQGERHRYNGGITSNYRSKQFNLFGNYSYYDGANTNFNKIYREQNSLFFDQYSDSEGGWSGHNFKAGADYFINKKHTIGVMVNGNVGVDDWANVSRTEIGMMEDNKVDSLLIAENRSDEESSNLNLNLNYQFDNGKGSTVNIDFDHGRFRNDAMAFQPNTYKDASGLEVLSVRNYRNNTPTDIDIYTAKVDVEQPFLEGKLGYGAKVALVETNNTFDFYNAFSTGDVLDINRSNTFAYTENVNAAYLNFNRQFEKFGVQAGLRMEQTNSEGNLTSFVTSNDNNVKRNYLDFFPSAGLTYQLNAKNSFQLTYSRRINRPSYQDLNPFEDKLDELTFERGNPFLNPEYTQSFQLTHTFNYFLNTSISYSHTTDLISRITDIADINATTITWLNLADQRSYSINVSGSVPVTKWWNSYTNITGYYLDNRADFEDGKRIDISQPSMNVYSQHTFTLPWDLSFEVSGWFNTASVWEGNFRSRPQGSMDVGLGKKILDGRGNLRVAFSDVLNTNNWDVRSTFGDLYIRASGGWDSQRVSINFSYSFGNNQVKSRRRSTGLEDEKKRIKD